MKWALRPSSWAVTVALGALVIGGSCKPNTRDNPAVCDGVTDLCTPPLVCRADHLCVAPGGSGGGGATGSGGGGGDAGPGPGGEAGGVAGAGGDAAHGGAGQAGSGGTPAGGASGAAGMGGAISGGGAGGGDHCESRTDCDGKPGTPACDLTTKTCVACTGNGDCGGDTPVCDTKTDRCVGCLADTDCPTAEQSFCVSNVCVGCGGAATGACKARDAKAPVCATSGACVGCLKDKDCPAGSTTPVCGPQNTCVACPRGSDGDAACQALDARSPVCGASGACVECGTDQDCTTDATKPFCSSAGVCVSCGAALASGGSCAVRMPGKKACSTSGACVECVGNTDCPDAKPVCSSGNTCGACAGDADCAGRGPGVCMSHQDGRCASGSETIYVQNGGSCSDTSGTAGGTAATPFCSMQPAVAAVTGTRAVVVVRGSVAGATSGFGTSVSIIGQSSGAILGSVASALHVTSGTTYARDLKLSSLGSTGLQADSGATVQLDHLLVTGNAAGGIQLDGAAFDIRNTTVTDNMPGTFNGFTVWGGILVNNPPPGGHQSLQLDTVENNKAVGIACSTSIAAGASGVLVTGNTSVDITPTCGFMSCAMSGGACGAQP